MLRLRLSPVLGAALAAALVVAGSGAAQPPDVSGAWSDPGGSTWQLTASGSGLSSLKATWKGSTKNGHPGLRGSFAGTLSGKAYTGSLDITEGSLHVTGTMTFTIVSADRISVTYTQSNGPHGTIDLKRQACGGCLEGPVKIQISFHANSLPTHPPSDGRRCPATAFAHVTGQIEAQITPAGDHQGGGNVVDTPLLAKCRVPNIKLAVDHIAVTAPTPGSVVRAVITVHIDGEAVHQPGQCQIGTTGTIVATYNDLTTAANSLPNHRLQIGPWSGPCNAHDHVITNNISSITADAHGSTWVRVWIGCLAGPGTGYAPRNCGS